MTQKSLKVEDLQRSTFDPYVGQKFLIHSGPSERLELELVNITEMKTNRSKSFSLLFRGPFDKVLTQMIYRMEHPEMGTFELFWSP